MVIININCILNSRNHNLLGWSGLMIKGSSFIMRNYFVYKIMWQPHVRETILFTKSLLILQNIECNMTKS